MPPQLHPPMAQGLPTAPPLPHERSLEPIGVLGTIYAWEVIFSLAADQDSLL
ncbi:hypothetical protein HETIRDRAFT_453453 [Heterobasidion irregulare TC 32-1]|uniref:Uncharacterized protein n=1 Tax=Heterobasidion irregulare (strain TC 32-1) TaxID=747525 RepID=W4K0P6_HETIT|nr:uncharacterized protein HETIRDRAFT_453453 [Heterobasidion irregulare TC 32-1]ETW78905.1 hypothetical protein HETIRDRAFT_453453 [Heterobasidion irregulare TC 32-1]